MRVNGPGRADNRCSSSFAAALAFVGARVQADVGAVGGPDIAATWALRGRPFCAVGQLTAAVAAAGLNLR